MDADKLNEKLQVKASELCEPIDIPSIAAKPEELALDMLALRYASEEHHDRIMSLERFEANICTLAGFAFVMAWVYFIVRIASYARYKNI
jgi:hypothetical protein